FVPEDVAKYFPEQYRDPDGMFALSRVYLSSIAYNPTLVKAEDAPKSYADLLDPKWAGMLVKGHPAYSGAIMPGPFQVGRGVAWGRSAKGRQAGGGGGRRAPRPRRRNWRSANAL